MVLGMSLPVFVAVHTILSLIAIPAGAMVAAGMLKSRDDPRWTAAFMALIVITCVTGFMFPFAGVTPAFITGIVTLIAAVPAIYAYYSRHLAGPWRAVYVVGTLTAFYLDCFVLVVQAFLKVPFIHNLAPSAPVQPEPPFAIAQGAVLLGFIVLGFFSLKRFHPAPPAAPAAMA